MSYQETFMLFWNQVETSIGQGEFAKLTLAKTIGKRSLKNIFIRPIYNDQDFKVELSFRYREREIDDKVQILPLEKAHDIVQEHLGSSFFSALLFTTSKDLTLKINKKGAGRLVENKPTFTSIP